MKWFAKKTVALGRTFDSRGEAVRAGMLSLLERGGKISCLTFQPVFKLTRAQIKYKADFSYKENGKMIIEDFKGNRRHDRRFSMIKQLWRYYGPHPLKISNAKGVYETINPDTDG